MGVPTIHSQLGVPQDQALSLYTAVSRYKGVKIEVYAEGFLQYKAVSLYKAVSRYKAAKIAWRNWGITLFYNNPQ